MGRATHDNVSIALVTLLHASLCLWLIRIQDARCTLQRRFVYLPVRNILCQKSTLWPLCGDVVLASTACVTVQFLHVSAFLLPVTSFASDAHARHTLVGNIHPILFHLVGELSVRQPSFTRVAVDQWLGFEEGIGVQRSFLLLLQ